MNFYFTNKYVYTQVDVSPEHESCVNNHYDNNLMVKSRTKIAAKTVETTRNSSLVQI